MQDCSISIANALEILQSCTKPSIWWWLQCRFLADLCDTFSQIFHGWFTMLEPWYDCRIANEAHYSDVIMSAMASPITSLNLTIVYSTVYSGADQRKHQSSALLAFVRGIHRWPVNSPHKGPVTRKMFPLDDVILNPGGYVYNDSNYLPTTGHSKMWTVHIFLGM